MKKTLRVWFEKEGYTVDKDITFDVNTQVIATVKKLNKPYDTVELSLERAITLDEYQNGFIGKYCGELKDLLAHFLQEYAILNSLEFVVDPKEIRTNEEELYELFSSYCEKNKLKSLEKPSGGSAYFITEEMKAQELVNLSNQQLSDPVIISALEWYNTGKLQQHSTNTFLHFFIPLELLSQKFIGKTNWKEKNKEKYDKIVSFLGDELKEKKFEHKLASLKFSLSRFAFMEQIKRYFTSIFTKEEIDSFWEDDSDITFNGKHQWKQYKLMSQQTDGKERVNLFKIFRRLYDIRNGIVHKGLREVASEDIFVLENILRRVLRKELAQTK